MGSGSDYAHQPYRILSHGSREDHPTHALCAHLPEPSLDMYLSSRSGSPPGHLGWLLTPVSHSWCLMVSLLGLPIALSTSVGDFVTGTVSTASRASFPQRRAAHGFGAPHSATSPEHTFLQTAQSSQPLVPSVLLGTLATSRTMTFQSLLHILPFLARTNTSPGQSQSWKVWG